MQTIEINGESYRAKKIPTEKRCCACDTVKSLDEFHNNKCRADGKCSECKICVRLRLKKRYIKPKPTTEQEQSTTATN